jgi:hypothetical protein
MLLSLLYKKQFKDNVSPCFEDIIHLIYLNKNFAAKT